MLAGCPDQPLPRAGAIALGGGPERAASSPSPSTTKARTATTPGSVYYKNCTAVRAAGAAPIHRGDPGYAPHLDRDGDGIGCE
ncbi:MAG TPA: excalibur calcium-binding domain-containing protein [Actinomycetales bacterium]|nr:excalibur calcium-binding domain-containing protein [Actinomycetales bacterium]